MIDKDGKGFRPTFVAYSRATPTDSTSKKGYTLNAANEIEGFLFNGSDAEPLSRDQKFEYVNTGGYYYFLPSDPLRTFIHTSAKSSAPWDSKMRRTTRRWRPRSSSTRTDNYSDVVTAADQIQLYKLICRQVAIETGSSASRPTQTCGRREWQRDAHQRFYQRER